MNDEYLEIYGRIFVNSYLGLREVQVDEKIANKLKLENLTEKLFYKILDAYSNHIFKLQQDLTNKKTQLKRAKEESSKQRKNKIIAHCIATPPASLLISIIIGLSLGITIPVHYILTTLGVATYFFLMIFLWEIQDYIKAKRKVPILEEEIPLLEQEISDRQQEKGILEERKKQQETVTLDTPGELHSLKYYNEKISDHLTSRFDEIEKLEDAKRILVELLQTKEIENFLANNGFTSEEAATASAELEKRFALQPIQPKQPNQQ